MYYEHETLLSLTCYFITMKNKRLTLAFTGLLLSGLTIACQVSNNSVKQENNEKTTQKMKTLHDFQVKDINGKTFDLAQLKGKKVMIINTASECGYTPQYEQLEKIYHQYKDKNFVVIGFPCNDFGQQEPGSEAEILSFCKKNYGVTFPMMAKVKILGDGQDEIYQWLTKKSMNGVEDTEVKWNFQKYLIDENGKYVRMVSTRVKPDDAEITNWIEGK